MIISTAYIEITDKCNLNCRTCYNGSGIKTIHREMPFDAFQKAINAFRPYGLKRVLISGGEPSLHSKFDNIVDYISSNNEIEFGIVTNGTSRNKKFSQLLNSGNKLTLQVSLDGSCEEVNKHIRDAGNFKRVQEFLSMPRSKNVKALLKMVVTKYNYYDIENYYKLALMYNCIPEFAFVFRSGNAANRWEEMALSDNEKMNAIKAVNSLNAKYGVEAYIASCTYKCPMLSNEPKMSVCVKPDGSIQPCQSLYGNEFTLGNINGFDSEIFNAAADNFLNSVKQRLTADFGCVRCPIQEHCGRGCPAEAVLMNGSLLASDSKCDFRLKRFFSDVSAKVKNVDAGVMQ
jgi:hypothetical protein